MDNFFIRALKIIDRKYFFNILYKLFFKKKEYSINIYYQKNKSLLNILCDKYQCDKGYFDLSTRIFFRDLHPHTYADFYSLLFDQCRNDIKKVFECGIGTNNPNLVSSMGIQYKPGSSLRVWKDYFPQANIYGGDIDRNILFEDQRIKTFEVDQLNESSIKKMWDNIQKDDFDLIIDDGMHTYDAAVTLLKNSFSKLRNGGKYIIEDIDPSYAQKLSDYVMKNYNGQIVILKSRSKNLLKDNNLILINKNSI